MKVVLIAPLLFLSIFTTTYAQSNKAKLFVVDQDIEADALSNQFAISKERADLTIFPEKETIDALLENEEFAQSWDELEKDIFYMNLKTRNMDYLRNKYPQISQEKLIKLKNKI